MGTTITDFIISGLMLWVIFQVAIPSYIMLFSDINRPEIFYMTKKQYLCLMVPVFGIIFAIYSIIKFILNKK